MKRPLMDKTRPFGQRVVILEQYVEQLREVLREAKGLINNQCVGAGRLHDKINAILKAGEE